MLPITIGAAEASSIDAEIHKQRPARPNSHDFAARLIAGLDAELLRVVVTEIRDGTFYAILVLEAHGKRVEIDARPSDAIATALRAGAPILVREEVFEQAGEVPRGARPRPLRRVARSGRATRRQLASPSSDSRREIARSCTCVRARSARPRAATDDARRRCARDAQLARKTREIRTHAPRAFR